jgi:hypothetical protein
MLVGIARVVQRCPAGIDEKYHGLPSALPRFQKLSWAGTMTARQHQMTWRETVNGFSMKEGGRNEEIKLCSETWQHALSGLS